MDPVYLKRWSENNWRYKGKRSRIRNVANIEKTLKWDIWLVKYSKVVIVTYWIQLKLFQLKYILDFQWSNCYVELMLIFFDNDTGITAASNNVTTASQLIQEN